jgi:hydroxyisourate hydrolase
VTTTISTHVLDTAAGRPAAGVPVTLEVLQGEWTRVAVTRTDDNGRVAAIPSTPGAVHRLVFDVSGSSPFFPEVTVVFTVADEPHYHVPLLLSPYGYSVYRGS